ncbi:hypothetical protein ACMD2_27081 [Ananas comosus]|uniref:Uncharacterized protein n=1 Tax=Ananas comosus TaxID=4615 RepID=A0A199W2K0_ANACO|nr:hypothetical protein ACMD2_27081 [Ananas comosus]
MHRNESNKWVCLLEGHHYAKSYESCDHMYGTTANKPLICKLANMTSTTKLSMKLLVDAKANKVLPPKPKKTCMVDFLFSLVALPVGTIIKLITKESMWDYICPSCKNTMTQEVTGENSNGENGLGVVKGELTYTIMDDLYIRPMSTISSITLLNTCN